METPVNILALDTATEACSAALLTPAGILDKVAIAPRQHGRLILPMMDALLAEAGMARTQLDAIAVGRGPGAFTGVRLAISVAQGLAFALDVPAMTVSSLQALACQVPAQAGACILSVMDARMGEVYAATYDMHADGLPVAISDEVVVAPDALSLAAGKTWQVIGTGWDTYAATLQTQLGSKPLWAAGEHYPLARDVARLARAPLAAGKGLSAEAILPVYLRNKVAQTLLERGIKPPVSV